MSNITEIQNIIQKNNLDLSCDPNKQYGWLKKALSKHSSYDPHTASIRLGNFFECIIPEIAKLRYTSDKLPGSIPGHGVSDEESNEYYNKRYVSDNSINRKNAVIVLTKLNVPKLGGFIEEFLEEHKKIRLTISDFIELSKNALNKFPIENEIRELPVDICLLNPHPILIEMKSTFMTDPKKSRGELLKILKAFIALGDRPKQFYFCIVSNAYDGLKKNGEWKGVMGKCISKELILLEEKFWDLISPKDVKFNDFQKLMEVAIDISVKKAERKRLKKTDVCINLSSNDENLINI